MKYPSESTPPETPNVAASEQAPRSGVPKTPRPPEGATSASRDTSLTKDETRNTLWTLGWAQGSILPEQLLCEVQRIPFAPPATDDEIPIILTQGCDAVHGDCEIEPALEVVFARPISEAKPGNKVLKNPRLLHVELVGPGGKRQPVEVSVWRRGFIERRLLLTAQPARTWQVPSDSLDVIVSLFVRRYDRVAFPEAFVERFRGVAERLEKFVKNFEAEITGVFLDIRPDEDFPLDEDPKARPYEVWMLFSMSSALVKDDARQAHITNLLKTDLLTLLNKTDGLRGKRVELMHPWRMTIGEFRDYTEWDHEPLRLGLRSKAASAKTSTEDPGSGDASRTAVARSERSGSGGSQSGLDGKSAPPASTRRDVPPSPLD